MITLIPELIARLEYESNMFNYNGDIQAHKAINAIVVALKNTFEQETPDVEIDKEEESPF
jgi:hypothetical protein